MSFGFGIGDAIAVAGLLERIVKEVRSYQNAPRHFQNLGIELQLLQKAFQRLFEIQPADHNDYDLLQQIRAIAIHCRQPLLTFIDKMRPKEASLGFMRSSGTLSTIGQRLHWSFISKKDIGELRQVVAYEIAAINMLLAVQQLEHLNKLVTSQGQSDSATNLHEFHSTSKDYFVKSMEILLKVGKTPVAFERLQALVSKEILQQKEIVRETRDQVTVISSGISALTIHAQSASVVAKREERSFIQVIHTLVSLAKDMRRLVVLLARFSKDILSKIALHGKLLLDIHAMMKRLVLAVEALPLHLTMAIIRLDDALGESWALPYQACQTFNAFQEVLQAVVFSKGRNGAMRVELGQYMLRFARTGQVVETDNWQCLVKEGAHISQAMIVSKQDVQLQKCKVRGCLGFVPSEEEPCTICCRPTFSDWKPQSHSETVSTSSRSNIISNLENEYRHFYSSVLRKIIAKDVDTYRVIESEPTAVDLGKTLQDRYQVLDLNSVKAFQDHYTENVLSFRSIQMVDCPKDFDSIEDAVRAVVENPLNAYAHQQIGLYVFFKSPFASPTGKFASEHLEWVTILDPSNFLNWYYLGQAYMRRGIYEKAHEAYKQALVRKDTHPNIWRSLAVMHFTVRCYQNSFDALEQCFKLRGKSNPTDYWNLAVLYWYWTNDLSKMAESLKKYLELNPGDPCGCYAWLEEYQAGSAEEPPSMLQKLQMVEPMMVATVLKSKAVDTVTLSPPVSIQHYVDTTPPHLQPM